MWSSPNIVFFSVRNHNCLIVFKEKSHVHLQKNRPWLQLLSEFFFIPGIWREKQLAASDALGSWVILHPPKSKMQPQSNPSPSGSQRRKFPSYLENKLLLISINFTPETRHSCQKIILHYVCQVYRNRFECLGKRIVPTTIRNGRNGPFQFPGDTEHVHSTLHHRDFVEMLGLKVVQLGGLWCLGGTSKKMAAMRPLTKHPFGIPNPKSHHFG